MRRWALYLLLALGGTANAALPRVALETPLAPASAPAFAAVPSALSASAALPVFGAAAAPSLSAAPSALAARPVAAPAALTAQALAPLPVPAALGAPRVAAAAALPAGPKAIDALKADAPLAEKLSASPSDAAAVSSVRALEESFDGAASLPAHGDGSVPAPASDVAAAPAGAARDPLLTSLLQHVRLDDDGVPERRAALILAFERMLRAPSARALAERFIADGVPAVVRLESFEGSRIYEVHGRRIFQAPQAFTSWKGDRVEVSVNLDYLDTDDEFQEQNLPPILAHELFGHGLWNSRAARENAQQALQHHELNETNARLVGWLVDFELDQRFEESGAWSYLSAPERFLEHLKLLLPYYALTWSTEELARPRETLEERSKAASAERDRLLTQLANHESWNAVIDHFASHHRIPESRLRALRAYMSETAQHYEDKIGVMNALIAEVDATVGRMNAEPDRASERYLQWAATHPMFADLRAEVDANTVRLKDHVARSSAKPDDESEASRKAREEHWRGQITFEELLEMYRQDRERHPEHWRS